MINGKKVLAIIPARGGSKGIPGKNIIQVAGKPLIQYTIEAAKGSKYIDEIHVSTDDNKIANVVGNLGIKLERLRPSNLAQDNTKTIDVIIDVLSFYKQKKYHFDIVILLQPTQPMRKTFHIDHSIELFMDNDEESIVSVSLVNDHPILMRQIDVNGNLVNLLKQSSTVRRQDFNPYYIVNGAIYINKTSEISNETSLNDNKRPYIMDKKYHVDIDTPIDLKKFEHLLNEEGEMLL